MPPRASGSFLATAETHAGLSTGTERCCHQLPQVNSPERQRAGPPSQEGGSSSLFWSGRGCGVLETRQTLTNSARFPLTSLQPDLLAQPQPEAPQHLSLPGSKACAARQNHAGALSSGGNQRSHWLGRWNANPGCSPKSPKGPWEDRTFRSCVVVVILA